MYCKIIMELSTPTTTTSSLVAPLPSFLQPSSSFSHFRIYASPRIILQIKLCGYLSLSRILDAGCWGMYEGQWEAVFGAWIASLISGLAFGSNISRRS